MPDAEEPTVERSTPKEPVKPHNSHPVRFYFVDEAGDPTLFNSKGHLIVGQTGCSRFFALGKLEVADPDGLSKALVELRRTLLADPYFRGVPSIGFRQ